MFEDDPYGMKGGKTKDEKATAFIMKHRDNTIAPIITFTSNMWNLMGSFRANRERIRFYNSNTAPLEAIADRIEMEQRLGADMMKHKKAEKRAENRAAGLPEEDPGDKKFKEWMKTNNSTASAGLEEDDPDLPDDAIAIPVIKISNGGLEVTRDVVYTEAQAPTYMLDRHKE